MLRAHTVPAARCAPLAAAFPVPRYKESSSVKLIPGRKSECHGSTSASQPQTLTTAVPYFRPESRTSCCLCVLCFMAQSFSGTRSEPDQNITKTEEEEEENGKRRLTCGDGESEEPPLGTSRPAWLWSGRGSGIR